MTRFKTESLKVADQKETQIYRLSVESFHGAELFRSIKSSFSLYKQFSRHLDHWATSFAEMWLKAPEEALKDLKPEIKVSNLLWSVTEAIVWGYKPIRELQVCFFYGFPRVEIMTSNLFINKPSLTSLRFRIPVTPSSRVSVSWSLFCLVPWWCQNQRRRSFKLLKICCASVLWWKLKFPSHFVQGSII